MTLLPTESLLRPVEGHDELVQFSMPFILEGKALENGDTAPTVSEADNGDLIIEGYAAVWEGDDREGENFMPGAFQRATKAFIDNGGPLCFHHKRDHVLGQVTELAEDDKGLRMKARVDGELRDHPTLKTLYGQIKKGTLRGLSVGGLFKRAYVAGKRKIADMDFTEISVTGVPVHTAPSFAVVAGKALADDLTIPAPPEVGEAEIREADLQSVSFLLEELDGIFRRLEESVGNRKQDDTTNSGSGSE